MAWENSAPVFSNKPMLDESMTRATSPGLQQLVPDLEAVCSRQNMNPLSMLLATFKILIYRYTKEKEIVVDVEHPDEGPLIKERHRVATSLSDHTVTADLLRETGNALNEAFSVKLESLFKHKSSLILTWRKPCDQKGGLSDEKGFSATIEVEAGGLCCLTFSQHALLCPTSSHKLIEEHFWTLLKAVLNHLSSSIGELPLITDEERNIILGEWSGAPLDPTLARSELLHELFEAQADAHPDHIALDCAGEQMTYAELDRKANQLARFLRSKGIGRNEPVAFMLPRSNNVFITLLAILKAGAAYVPLDSDYPEDRVTYILSDCKVHVLITTSSLAVKHPLGDFEVLPLDLEWKNISRESEDRLRIADLRTTPEDLCYIIYTSGSTGRPKGVEIKHLSACNFVRAEARIFKVRPDDRVFQGFSVAFDASVEEIWLAFFSGATLVVGTLEMVHAGPDLSRILAVARVTVLSCVPTLLTMMEEDIPTIRLLIVGGERCGQYLVRRWFKAGRRMVNTYGPTEATVVATLSNCDPAKPVNIGRPLLNYRVYILDSSMQPVPVGITGEIYIGGVGLSRGYAGKPDLTAAKFVPNPFGTPSYERLYRTGDLGRYTLDGEIEYMGRTDEQVKIRGFRTELPEIESTLVQHPEVLAAAVALREDTPGIQQLIGYIVPRGSGPLKEDAIKDFLRSQLPDYMIPSFLEPVADLPTLPSGKIDRRRLPPPALHHKKPGKAGELPRTEFEKKLAAVWQRLFGLETIPRDANFFLNLGGHSLLAAQMVSELRHDPLFQNISVLDVYEHPTLERLAFEFETRPKEQTTKSDMPKKDDDLLRTGRKSTLLSNLAQVPGLYVVIGFSSMQWLAPYLTYVWMAEEGFAVRDAILGALGVLLLLYPVMTGLSIITKWLVIGRFKPGSYPLWGPYYLRWWFANQIISAIPIQYMVGTPLLNIYLRLMGAKIGSNVHIGTDNIRTFDLISIGDDSSIGQEACLRGYTVEEGMLKLGPIAIGERCFVGARSVINQYTLMEDDSNLGDLSMLPSGAKVPRWQSWIGSPARPLSSGKTGPVEEAKGCCPSRRAARVFFGMLHGMGVFVLPSIYLAAIFPGIILLNSMNRVWEGFWYLLLCPLVALSFVVFLCLEIAMVKWLVLGRVKAGCYKLQSSFYVRKWFVDQLMEISLDILGPLYATLFLNPWYRLMGVKVGKNVEISTASSISHELLSIDGESFIADGVSLGPPYISRGILTVSPTMIGKRSFIGNSALIPNGSVIGDGTLIGVLSTPPLLQPGAAEPSTSWFGSPSIFLPRRQTNTDFPEEKTFKPTRKLYMQRIFIEFFRVILPATFFILFSSLLIAGLVLGSDLFSMPQLILMLPVMYLICGIGAALVVVLTKWLLMGRYTAGEKPLWSSFVWRTELLTAMHEHLADPFLVQLLLGTPWVCWFFRLLGAKIGSRVYMETTALTEFDLISIGDDVSLNFDCTVQTHLFEDRVMKMSTISIGNGSSVGCGSVVLYDTVLEEGVVLGGLSLVMKGETLPAQTRWEGTPSMRAAAEPETPKPYSVET